jgi:hypothetical protein
MQLEDNNLLPTAYFLWRIASKYYSATNAW